MKTVLSTILGIVLGVVATFVLVIGVEAFSAVVHPFPADFGGTHEEICRHVERYPAWVLAVAAVLWAATAWIGTWLAGRVGNVFAACTVALLIFAAVAFNVSMLPYPLWFKIACLVMIPAASAAAVKNARASRSPPGATPQSV